MCFVGFVQVQLGFKGDRARKINQFTIVFHLLQNGRPMLEYKSLKQLFTFLKMPNLNKKHQDDNSSWLIVEYLHKQVMVKSREVLSATKYLAITCDEVTTVDNQSWISIHAYCVQDFYRQPILISLECLTKGSFATRLAITINNAMINFMEVKLKTSSYKSLYLLGLMVQQFSK